MRGATSSNTLTTHRGLTTRRALYRRVRTRAAMGCSFLILDVSRCFVSSSADLLTNETVVESARIRKESAPFPPKTCRPQHRLTGCKRAEGGHGVRRSKSSHTSIICGRGRVFGKVVQSGSARNQEPWTSDLRLAYIVAPAYPRGYA